MGGYTIFRTGTEQRLLLGSSLGVAYGLAEARSSCSEGVSEMTAFGHKQTWVGTADIRRKAPSTEKQPPPLRRDGGKSRIVDID